MDSLLLEDIVRIVPIGVGATVVMDLWLALLKRLKVRSLDMALVGRWAGHGLRGRWAHEAIAKAEPVTGERAWGWALHYAIGIAFAAALVALCGRAWMQQPSLGPALAFGAVTVLVPLFVMQPAMGAGVASSKTPTPLRNCFKSLVTHCVFGAGLYLAAVVMARVLP